MGGRGVKFSRRALSNCICLGRFKAAGVDELILLMDMGTVPHEIVTESLRTFAEKVMAHFG